MVPKYKFSIGDTVLTKIYALGGEMDVKGFITACSLRPFKTLYQINSTGGVEYDGFTFHTTRMILIEKISTGENSRLKKKLKR
ncbi:MAG: hypothetical protein Q8O88_04050 [bacterium]|nr:hypothetical protein [bacterium]